ncbi:MAG: BMP family ABC transporter substrate-binding protein [Pelolinea sp.]|jgi:basic membrane protein A|nr:BMP family ABC transporter substrate-binding protein [Pelolinea sp.]
MTKKISFFLSLLIIASVLLVSCKAAATEEAPAEEPAAEEPAAEEPAAETPKLKFCQVTDMGGIDDKSFNATAWKGMEQAATDFGVEVKYLESQQQSDYEVNLNAFVEEKCDLIVSVGFLLADATSKVATANPDMKFAIIDNGNMGLANVRGNYSDIQEATFLAGYLAAGMTKTGKVGTYVGILFPSTQAFMDGYAMGVAYYNQVHGTAVEVLGWDMETQEGLEVGNFESLDDGRAMGETLLDEGADIIMPVAGPVGAGTLAVMQERGTGLLIGVDDDWSVKYPDQADYILASTMKKIDVFVYDTISQVINGEYKGGEDFALTLENNGVGLVYGTAWVDQIPADLAAEIEALIPQIIDGSIAVMPTR